MNIIISTITTLGILLLGWNTLTMDDLEYLNASKWLEPVKLGAFTEIAGTNQLSNFPTVYNANLAKTIEVGTTSVASITTLPGLTTASSLSTVGTLTSGSLSTGFTAVPVSLGGSGTTTPSTYQVVLGNGSLGFTVASSTGTSGQLLTSNGPGAYPSWQSVSFDTTANYTNTGQWIFNTQNVGIGTTTPIKKLGVNGDVWITGTTTASAFVNASSSMSINGVAYGFPASQGSATSTLQNNGSGGLSWVVDDSVAIATSTAKGVTASIVLTHGLGRLPKKVKITTHGQIANNADNGEVGFTSVGVATSTLAGTQSYSTLSVFAAGVADLVSGYGKISVGRQDAASSRWEARVSAWTTTTLTITIDTNEGSGANDGYKHLLVEIE